MDPLLLLKIIIALPIIFFVPGYVIFSAFRVQRIRSLKLGFLETVFFQVLISMVIAGLIAFVLALLGLFSLTLLLVLLSIICIVIAVRYRSKLIIWRFPKPKLTLHSVLLILVMIVAVGLFAHPFEFDVFHYREAGTNINTGIILAKNGTFLIHDSLFSSIPAEYRSSFFQTENDRTFLFPTYPLFVDGDGTLDTYFPLFYPVWIAIFFSIFGLIGTLFINPVFAILSVLGFYLLLRRMMGSVAALLASSFLAVSFLMIFFAWYHGSESLLLLLMILFLLSFQYYLISKRDLFAVFSALLMTELLLTRIEAVLLIVGLLLFAIISAPSTRRQLRRFAILFLIVLPVVVFTYVAFYPAYVVDTISSSYGFYVRFYVDNLLLYLLVASGILVAVGVLFRKEIGPTLRRHHRVVLLAILAGFFAYALISYPTDREFNNLNNLVSLSWYMGVPAVLLSLLGLVLFTLKSFQEHQKLLLSLYIPFFIVFIQNLHNYPLHPWAMRRYIAVLYPFLVAFLAYFVVALATAIRRNMPRLNARFGRLRPDRIVLLGLAGLLLISFVSLDGPLLMMIERAPGDTSVIEQLEEMDAYFPDGSIIIFHLDSYELTPALPLKFIWQRNTILMERLIIYGDFPSPRVRILDEEAIAENDEAVSKYVEMAKTWEARGLSVYVINPSPKFLSKISSYQGVDLIYERDFVIEFVVFPLSYNAVPGGPVPYHQVLAVFGFSIS